MKIDRRQLLQWTAVTCGSAAVPFKTFAQPNYPSGPVRVVVPFTAGSTTDVISRIVGERLNNYLVQPFVVDNKPGAGGTLGAAQVATSPADGQTLLIHSAGHVANASLYPTLKYDTLKDFASVAMLASMPNVLVVSPQKGYTSLQDLIAKVKKSPGTFSYGSSGSGSGAHIAGEKFRMAAGLDVLHVPYRGTPEGVNDVIGGRIDWFLLPLALAVQLVQAGKLKALSIGASKRSPLLPNVPTTTESGLRNADQLFWVGMFAPAKTPHEVVTRLNAEVVKALKAPETITRFEKLGVEATPMSQPQFAKFVSDEFVETAALIKQAGIRLES